MVVSRSEIWVINQGISVNRRKYVVIAMPLPVTIVTGDIPADVFEVEMPAIARTICFTSRATWEYPWET